MNLQTLFPILKLKTHWLQQYGYENPALQQPNSNIADLAAHLASWVPHIHEIQNSTGRIQPNFNTFALKLPAIPETPKFFQSYSKR